jgi:hypothetical protein
MRQNKKPFGDSADMIPVNNVSAHRFLKLRQTPKMSDRGPRARGSGPALGNTQWMM